MLHADAGDMAQLGGGLDVVMLSAMGIIAAVMGFVVLFYCLGSLYDDRRDRSILFWKSLPISDTRTVLSKVASAVVMAPVIAVVVGIAVGIVQLLIAAAALSFHGVHVWTLLTLAHPFRVIFTLLLAIPTYALWALPAVGWLMLCSAWARSKPFLWAIALPLVTGLIVTWFQLMGLFHQTSGWFWHHVVQRLILSVFPASNLVFDSAAARAIDRLDDTNAWLDPTASLSMLASVELWIGAIVGVAMLAGAVYFRRIRDDS